MSWKILATLAVAMLLVAGCGGGLSPDTELEDEIGSDAAEIEDEWEDAEEELLAWGRPVEEDWPCMTWPLSADGAVLVEVESGDFDPVLAVFDEDGGIIALCDDWEGDLEESMIALESVPEGATLILFGAQGDDGDFELSCTEADEDEVEDFAAACDLSDGSLEGYKPDDKDDELLEEMLADVLEDQMTKDFSNAAVHGFTVDEAGPVRVVLESEDFDPYLVLVEVDDDDLRYIDYNDDADGYNSAIMGDLEEGRYLAVVLSYSDGEGGDFHLGVEMVDPELMEADAVSAEEMGVDYYQEVTADSPMAFAYIGDSDAWVSGLSGFTHVACFEFTVEETGLYQMDAFADMTDVVLSVWEKAGDTPLLVDYNDDGGNTGTDSRLMLRLVAGDYLAVVNSLGSDVPDEELGFSWQTADQETRSLRMGRAAEALFTYQETDYYYAFEVEEAGTLIVTADAVTEELDPIIDLWGPDGQSYGDDDGGEGFNSLLEVDVSPSELGEWTLHLSTYGGEGRVRVRVEHEAGGQSLVDTGEMPEPEEPPAEEPSVAPAPGTAGI